MPYGRLRGWLGGLLILLAVILIVWSYLPPERLSLERQLTWQELLPVELVAPGTSAPRLKFSWPDHLHSGATGQVKMELLPESQSESQTSHFEIDTEIRLELFGFKVLPAGEQRQHWQFAQPMRVTWNILASHPGSYSGVIWLHTNSPHTSNGQGIRQLVAAQSFNIRVSTLAGLEQREARMASVLCMLVGLTLNFDHLGAIRTRNA